MRKFFLLLCVLSLLLCACNRETVPTTDLLATLLSLPNASPPDADIYFAQGAADARLEQIVDRLYGADAAVLTHLADYAVFLGRSTSLYEIHILRAISPSDVPILRRLLDARAKLLCLATEEGHPTERNAVVCERGQLLFLFATPCNSTLLQAAIA